MIECISCKQVIDVDDDVAYKLGWHFEDIYYSEDDYESMWWCPHCAFAEIN